MPHLLGLHIDFYRAPLEAYSCKCIGELFSPALQITVHLLAIECHINHIGTRVLGDESDETSAGILHLHIVRHLALIDRYLQLSFACFDGINCKNKGN